MSYRNWSCVLLFRAISNEMRPARVSATTRLQLSQHLPCSVIGEGLCPYGELVSFPHRQQTMFCWIGAIFNIQFGYEYVGVNLKIKGASILGSKVSEKNKL